MIEPVRDQWAEWLPDGGTVGPMLRPAHSKYSRKNHVCSVPLQAGTDTGPGRSRRRPWP
jgi:hypothetical protein